MKNTRLRTTMLMAAILLVLPASLRADDGDSAKKTFNDLRVGVMHPWEVSEGPATCELCGMELQQVIGHQLGTPAPPIDSLYIDPDNPMWIHEGAGTSPSGKTLIPITKSPYYEGDKRPGQSHTNEIQAGTGHPGEMAGMNRDGVEHTAKPGNDNPELWTCGMHPEVIEDHEGTCPICGMNLVPLRAPVGTSSRTSGERKVRYWVAPMDPNYISDKPGKSPMGMDLVPVYEEEVESGGATVSIDPVSRQNIGVVSQQVERRDLSREIHTNASVEVAEDRETIVTSRVTGYIEKLYVARTGDRVRKGQPLLAVYSPELVTAQEELLLAKRTLGSAESGGLDQMVKSSRSLLNAARKRLSLWDISEEQIAAIEESGEIQRRLELKSPTDGIVLEKKVIEGDAVKPGANLYRIGNLNRIWVIAQVYEFELPWVNEGDKVQITSSYDPFLSMSGKIEYIYPTLDAKSRTADVRISVLNPEDKLKPDMWVDVEILVDTRKQVVAVPKSAVIHSGKRDIVFIDQGGGLYEPREVKVGVETGAYYEVASGIEPGQNVVVSAQFLLDSEAKLQEAIQKRIAKKMASAREKSANQSQEGMTGMESK